MKLALSDCLLSGDVEKVESDRERNAQSSNGSGMETAAFNGLSDEHLFKLLKSRREDAMTALYRRYSRLLASIAYNILHDRAEAEDMVQEVFVEALRKIDQYDPSKGRARVWLMRVAYTRSMDRRKYLDSRNHYDLSSPLPQFDTKRNGNGNGNGYEPHYRPDPLIGLSLEERQKTIKQALLQLPEKQRVAIMLACFQGLSVKDIAASMNESHVNARNYYYRGLRKLREIVDTELDGQSVDSPGDQRATKA